MIATQLTIQSAPAVSDDSPCVRFVCTEASRGAATVDVPLALLSAVGADLGTHDGDPNPRGVIGSLHLSQVDSVVLRQVVNFFHGYPFFVNLGTLEKPLAYKQKLWLIQLTHLAHILKIECIQRAAMHAVCASILRRSEDWSDTSASQRLLEEFTHEGNPARQVLLEGPGCMLPSATGKETLPCSQQQSGINLFLPCIRLRWNPGFPTKRLVMETMAMGAMTGTMSIDS